MSQINFLKGLAILGVVFVHTIPANLIYKWQIAFSFNQQVPIFIILSGITAMLSCTKKGLFNDIESVLIYSKKYILRRIKSITPNILIIFIISTLGWILLDLILGIRKGYGLGIYSLIGRPPLDGPGAYYIAILFQIITLTPVLVYYFNTNDIITLFIMVIINFLFEVFIARIEIFSGTYLYKACILRYFTALGLGMYISKDLKMKTKRNLFIVFLAPLSLIYIYIIQQIENLFFLV